MHRVTIEASHDASNMAEQHSLGSPPHTVILLLGAPGIGKSYFGKEMVKRSAASAFIDIGCRLKYRGDIERCTRLPFNKCREELKDEALKLLNDGLDTYMQTDGKLPLLVTFVKEPKDGYIFMDAVAASASRYGVQSVVNSWFLRDDEYVIEKV